MSPANRTATTLKRVLLMDPNDRTRGMAALRLAVMDIEVLEAASPREALSHMANGRPHLVVTDWPLGFGNDASLFHGMLRTGPVPVVYCSFGTAGLEEGPPPTRAGHALVSKLDRQAMLAQVSQMLSGVDGITGLKEEVRRRVKGPRQIMVIEDSQTLRGIIRRAIQKAFPEDVIREAEDGRVALQGMTHQKVDLIITDLEMPGMDGLTFLNHVKRNPILANKPVLIFSGKITDELRANISGMAHVRLLAKPADPVRIVAEVSFLLG